MAIIGHWIGSFPLSYLVPHASVTLLCKMAMLSDVVCGLLVLLKIELAATFPWYVSTPPPATVELTSRWKSDGQWLPKMDESAEHGFKGFPALFPFYLDITYSHSIEGITIVALVIALLMRLRYKISLGYAAAILLAAISHPILDMFFHDAYVLAGNRAVTRVTFNFWQVSYIAPFAFLLECGLALVGFRVWWSTRVPISDDPDLAARITYYKKLFWSLSLSHNMTSFYIVSPLLIWSMYKLAPNVQFGTPACYWSLILFAITMWSWTFALYPLYKLEALTRVKHTDAAVDGYQKIP